MKKTVPAVFLAVSVGAAIVACQSSSSGEQPQQNAQAAAAAAPAAAAPAAADPAAATDAVEIFNGRCVPCHGAQGAGDGPASAGLTPKPRNFQDPEWQKSVTEDHIEKIIVGGGAAVGRSPMMPGNPDLASKPAVVTELRKHIRGLAK